MKNNDKSPRERVQHERVRREPVSLLRCAPQESDEFVVRRTEHAITQLGDYGRPFHQARTIAVKINAGTHRVVLTHGKQTEITDPAVIEGTVRALRAVTDAEILIGDATTDGDALGLYDEIGLTQRLAPYPRVRLIDFSDEEPVEAEMTHAAPMFRRYTVPRAVAEADAIVSVAKMKAHTGTGCTLSIKNLFGWLPMAIYGRPRLYLHDRLIRLPRVLCDLAQWLRPQLCVVDGTAALNKREWSGEVLCPGVVLAGANAVATDSVGARVMGFDPDADYPQPPFFYRRNPIRLAAQAGVGPLRADDIEVLGEAPEAVRTPFEVTAYRGHTQRDEQLQRGAQCVAAYRERQSELAARYAGRLLSFFDGELLWDAPDMAATFRLEKESGRDWQTRPQLVVRCIAPEHEIEQFDWYAEEAEFSRRRWAD